MLFTTSFPFILICCLLSLTTSHLAHLEITLDLIDIPDSQNFPQQAKNLILNWDPFISQILNAQEANPPRSIILSFQKGLPAAGMTVNNTIYINVDSINSDPNNFGLVIHQYTYIIQQYRDNQLGYDSSWLTTGIADYIRYICYEPNPNNSTDPTPADSWFTNHQPQPSDTYKSGYGNAARFLFWISEKYNISDLIPQLNEIQRQAQYQPSIFEDITSVPVNELWNEYAAEVGMPSLKAPLEIGIQIINSPVNASNFPEQSRDLVTAWDPVISQLLSGQEANAPRFVKFVFQKGLSAAAITINNTIYVNVDSIDLNPNNLGMMIHEYVHVVQQYPGNQLGYNAGWLTEGIADYVRYIYYEINPDNPTDPTLSDSWFSSYQPQPSNTYKSGYRNAARFLYWVSQRYNVPDLVPELNKIQRQGQYQPSVFVNLTSMSLNDLWNAYAIQVGRPDLLIL